eukprot:3976498-Karenia_brevis.AAC.1
MPRVFIGKASGFIVMPDETPPSETIIVSAGELLNALDAARLPRRHEKEFMLIEPWVALVGARPRTCRRRFSSNGQATGANSSSVPVL